MISVEEALQRIMDLVPVLPAENQALLNTLGQVLTEDVCSQFNIPPVDNSAMDGFAVRSVDTTGASENQPKVLRVIGEVAAGHLPNVVVTPGTAVRIMTGAPIPNGADTVVQFEHTDEVQRQVGQGPSRLDTVSVLRETPADRNIRRNGEDIRKGSLVIAKGTTIRPSEIGVLASLGLAHIRVHRRPVIAILATGDELVELGSPLPNGKIYNSNTYSIAAQVLRYGGVPRLLGIAEDRLEDLEAKIAVGTEADMLITSAGVSTGDYDIVKDVLVRKGQINFWTVRMKPGKPLAFGTFRTGSGDTQRQVPHLGLPGNPVSSMVAFEQFGRPAILKMLGRRNLDRRTVEAVVEDEIENRDGRRYFVRAVLEQHDGEYHARVTGPQGSGILTSMAAANGLIVVPETTTWVKPGDRLPVQLLDWPY